MAGEGMNMAIQDADVLGSLLAWMFQTGRTEQTLLRWYERVRKPRAQFVAGISHLSALAYSFPFTMAHALRARVLAHIANNEYLLKQYMTNISGLGMAKETIFDRALQLGLLPTNWGATFLRSPTVWFSERTDYPWLYS
jgi:2-polyprenyl-6-methoxyphenol hydroxylase-like FAD-dependent oxidoreductase